MANCVVCKSEVVWSDVLEEFEDLFTDVDYFGVESLPEEAQTVYHGHICSYECYMQMDLPVADQKLHEVDVAVAEFYNALILADLVDWSQFD